MDIEYLKSVLKYDPETGCFTWIAPRNRRIKPGDKAGSHDKYGYGRLNINKKSIFAHRLAWAMFYGEWPEGQIDHINGVKDDNRISNLRIATNTQNSYNSKRTSKNKTGFRGVRYRLGRYDASCSVNGEPVHLGRFDTAEEASECYESFIKSLHGEFYNGH